MNCPFAIAICNKILSLFKDFVVDCAKEKSSGLCTLRFSRNMEKTDLPITALKSDIEMIEKMRVKADKIFFGHTDFRC